jgi:hypothetical protein
MLTTALWLMQGYSSKTLGSIDIQDPMQSYVILAQNLLVIISNECFNAMVFGLNQLQSKILRPM